MDALKRIAEELRQNGKAYILPLGPPDYVYTMRVDMPIEQGQAVVIDKNGKIAPFLAYNRRERLVRWVGKSLRIRRWAMYHERRPIGFAMGPAQPGESVVVVQRMTMRLGNDD